MLSSNHQHETTSNAQHQVPKSETDTSTTDKEMVGVWNPTLSKPFLGLYTPHPPPHHHFSDLVVIGLPQQLTTQETTQ